MSGRSFIDTNIFLYAHDISDPGKREIARELIFTEYKTGNCTISTQVLAEFFQNSVVKFGMPYIDAIKELHFMSRCTVIDQTISLIAAGAGLFDKYFLSFWDSMIVAAAIEASVDTLYTEDFGGDDEIEGIKIINPFH